MPEVPLNYIEPFLFHGGDTGSTPVQDVISCVIKAGPAIPQSITAMLDALASERCAAR